MSVRLKSRLVSLRLSARLRGRMGRRRKPVRCDFSRQQEFSF